jgi:hypothetical protein
MIKLDSFKFKLPIELINNIDISNHKAKHLPISETFEGREKIIQDKIIVSHLDHGFNRVTIDNLENEIIIEGSAKILKSNYYDGICMDTFEQLHYELTRHKLIDISQDNLLKAKMYTLDATVNLEVKDIKQSVRATVEHGTMTSNYIVKNFTKGSNFGFTAIRDVKTYKERSTGYSKLMEVLNTKSNFAKDYPEAIKRFNLNTLRLESNFANFAHVRDHFKVTSNTLGAILNSQENVNLKMFERIIHGGKQLELFSDAYEALKFQDIIKEIGYKGFFEKFNYDLNAIKTFIKVKYPRKVKSNPAARYITIVSEKYAQLTKDQRHFNNQFIQELTEKLKTA